MSWYIRLIIAVVAFGYGVTLVRMVLECAHLSAAERKENMSIALLLSSTVCFLVFVWRAVDLGRYL